MTGVGGTPAATTTTSNPATSTTNTTTANVPSSTTPSTNVGGVSAGGPLGQGLQSNPDAFSTMMSQMMGMMVNGQQVCNFVLCAEMPENQISFRIAGKFQAFFGCYGIFFLISFFFLFFLFLGLKAVSPADVKSLDIFIEFQWHL